MSIRQESAVGAGAVFYDEETFHYFLALEEKRSERSGRPILLLLVDLNWQEAWSERDSRIASQLFEALAGSVRETDFVGWYRAKRVVGAVLSQPVETAGADVRRIVRDRVVETLIRRFPRTANAMNVEVHRVPFEPAETEASLWHHTKRR
jgi:hypothetical protein